MAGTREQIMTALQAVFTASGQFVTISRRNRSPESLGPTTTPALMLLNASELWERQSINLPPKVTLKVTAAIYDDIGQDENALPATAINNVMDYLRTAMAPDNMMTGCFTLGGLVQSCVIDGEVVNAPGDITGKSIAIVPISILIP